MNFANKVFLRETLPLRGKEKRGGVTKREERTGLDPRSFDSVWRTERIGRSGRPRQTLPTSVYELPLVSFFSPSSPIKKGAREGRNGTRRPSPTQGEELPGSRVVYSMYFRRGTVNQGFTELQVSTKGIETTLKTSNGVVNLP